MAIQVNGTTVIDNSRALTNITSLDATTTATISAAGGGGGWELLSNTNISSDTSYIEYNFPTGYSEFRFIFNNLLSTRTGNYEYTQWRARLKNSGGSLITSQVYYSLRSNSTSFSAGGATDWNQLGILGVSNSNNNAQVFTHDVILPRRSDVRTTMRTHSVGQWARGPDGDHIEYDSFSSAQSIRDAEDNTGIRFYPNLGSIDATSDEWMVLGVPDA